MTGGRVVLLVVGSVVALLALAAVLGGGALLVINHTERDSDGFFSSSAESYRTSSYALVSDSLDVGTDGPDWLFKKGRLATLRVRGSSASRHELFIGIAPTNRVKKYLAGTSYDVVSNLEFDPFGVKYQRSAGGSAPARPEASSFWSATAHGAGRRSLEWKVGKGNWSAVVMNADASPGVDVKLSLGAKIGLIFWIALALLLGGIVLLAGGAVMIYLSMRRRGVVPAPAVSAAG